MQKEDYLEIQSQIIDLFDSELKKEIKQVDIEAKLDDIKFEKTDELKDYFFQNCTRQTIRNYIISLGSQLNLYPVRILKLEAWNHLFEKRKSKDDKIFILQDRIIPFSTLLLTEPNVIKNRIAFFYFTSLSGEFKISNFDADEKYSVDQINNDFYQSKADKYDYDLSKINDLLWNISSDKIKEFRDNYTHKIASNIGLGHFNEFETSSQGGMSAVAFKTQSPIGVNEVVELAKSETDNLFAAFEELMNFFKQVSNYT